MMCGATEAAPAARPVRRIVRRDTPIVSLPEPFVVVALQTCRADGGILRIAWRMSSARSGPGDCGSRCDSHSLIIHVRGDRRSAPAHRSVAILCSAHLTFAILAGESASSPGE